MAQSFIECNRVQVFLVPPSLRLPGDHLAWFVLEAVGEMDLTGFYADFRSDGHGRAAYEPSMMVALLFYAYATGQRSSRGIEHEQMDSLAAGVGHALLDHQPVQLSAREAPQRAAVTGRQLARDRDDLGDLLRGENVAGDPRAACP